MSLPTSENRFASDRPAHASPCIGVCEMDEASGYCRGCYRTIEEIRTWRQKDAAGKQDILDRLADRQNSFKDKAKISAARAASWAARWAQSEETQ